ncbi:MAG: hypothetical protein AAF628_08290 [Planctomycetota bacterium]
MRDALNQEVTVGAQVLMAIASCGGEFSSLVPFRVTELTSRGYVRLADGQNTAVSFFPDEELVVIDKLLEVADD